LTDLAKAAGYRVSVGCREKKSDEVTEYEAALWQVRHIPIKTTAANRMNCWDWIKTKFAS
jgi:hypothetical protein